MSNCHWANIAPSTGRGLGFLRIAELAPRRQSPLPITVALAVVVTAAVTVAAAALTRSVVMSILLGAGALYLGLYLAG